jgi:hypothetical protein
MIRTALILVAGIAAVNTASAQRTLEVVEGAGEYPLSQLELPADGTGSLAVKPCTGCQTTFHRVTSATKYMLDGSPVAYADLALVIEEIRAAGADERTLVGVFIDRASQDVTRILLHNPLR